MRLALHTRRADFFLKKIRWRISHNRREWAPAEVEGFRPLPGGKALAKFAGINDRDNAAKMRGFHLAVLRADLPETDRDEFYWHDLVGMEVRGRDGGALGKVAGLIRTGAHDILRVSPPADAEGSDEKSGEILIPFVAECAPEVDLASGVIRTEWEADW